MNFRQIRHVSVGVVRRSVSGGESPPPIDYRMGRLGINIGTDELVIRVQTENPSEELVVAIPLDAAEAAIHDAVSISQKSVGVQEQLFALVHKLTDGLVAAHTTLVTK